ncbi:MAG: class I SAM-dependent methyltransferase [Betaproteobacteria bacterium]
MSTSHQPTYWKSFYSQEHLPTDLLTPSEFCRYLGQFSFTLGSPKRLASTVLDAGCGTGRDSYEFAKRGMQVTGVDSCGWLPTVRGYKAGGSVSFQEGDFCSLDKTGFDIVYSRFTFHSITDEEQETFLESIHTETFLCIEARSSLNDGLSDEHYHYGETHYRNLTDGNDLIRRLLRQNYNILDFTERRGLAPYHNEDPICVRVIAQKGPI